VINIAKIKLEIEFENKDWTPIKIENSTSDKNAYRIFRMIVPKKSDFEQEEKPQEKE
jgi:hypothetical protein